MHKLFERSQRIFYTWVTRFMVLRCRTESRQFFFYVLLLYSHTKKNTSDTNFPFPLVGIHLSLVISIRTVAIFNITSQREDNDNKKKGGGI